jgi:phosphoserine phosphatase RsbU/P
VCPEMTVQDELAESGPGEPPRSAKDFAARDRRRQNAVEQMLVLDSAPEERFDRLTRLAQGVFSVPMSTITLVDRDRVWRKSCAGVSVRESPRSESFCGATVAVEQMLIVEDARLDQRFSGLRAVAGEPGIRFYAGYPLRDGNGIVVGTFCLFDVVPRSLDDGQQRLLAELGGWAQQELVDSADTERARKVQQQLLPTTLPQFGGYDIAAICVPAHTVGGDFYDYGLFGDRFGFCVADVMGKGTSAAITTATVRAALRGAARRSLRDPGQEYKAADLLTSTSRAVHDDLEDTSSLVTVFAASIDRHSGKISYADAGHGLAVAVSGTGSARWLASVDLPLGVDPDAVWSEHEASIRPGDTLLCFSDGLLELFGGTQDGLNQIAELVALHREPTQLVDQIRDLTMGLPLADDVTAIAVRRHP